MIIVPELQTVFVLVPRTGSGSLYRGLLKKYPRAMLLYRHMEADGVPQGYDRWRRIGFVRHPLARMQSLFKFMQTFGGGAQIPNEDNDKRRIHKQVAGKTFEEWLLTNMEPWTVPFDLNGDDKWWPLLAKRNTGPENRTSQFQYLRPDMGTEVRIFETQLASSFMEWGLDPSQVSNATELSQCTASYQAWEHLERFCKWDLDQYRSR